MRWFIAYLATTVAMVVVDMVWLKGIAGGWYQQGIGHLMAADVRLAPAAVFYLLYPIGLLVFVVAPSVAGDTPWWRAAAMGALFGLFAYATYDLTNLATLKDWPVGLSLADMAWGAFVGAVASAAGRAAATAW